MIFVNIHLHPLLLLLILLSLLTGTFIQLFIILFIVLIHELGHYLAATYYKWRIDYIMLWVFGGVMKTDESSHRSIKEECIVTLAGPFQHIILFFVLTGLSVWQLLPEPILQQAHYYNGIILMFNLLPIYPLDGGKFLLLIQSAFTPYYVATRRIFYLSMLFLLLIQSAFTPYYVATRRIFYLSMFLCFALMVMQLMFFPFTVSAFALCLFLLLENYRALKEHYYSFIRFLLSRMDPSARKRMEQKSVQEDALLMDVFKQFRRNRMYRIRVQRKLVPSSVVTEQYCLHAYFTKKQITATMGEVIEIKENE